MVFVSKFLLVVLTLVIFTITYTLGYFFYHSHNINLSKSFLSRFIFRNFFFSYFLSFIYVFFNLNSLSVLIVVTMVAYLQGFLWLSSNEARLLNLRFNEKLYIIKCLGSTAYRKHSTKWAQDRWDAVRNEFDEIVDDTLDSIDDFKWFFFNIKPSIRKDKILETLKLIKRLMCPHLNIFTQKDVADEFKKNPEAFMKRLKALRDPNILFNRLRRLPLYFKHDQKIFNEFKFFSHAIIFYNFIKTSIIALFCVVIYFLYTIFFFKIQFLKQLSVWFVIGMLFFWLISGFNFFLKRYQFGKFTSQIQRFWKRTNTYFWLIEGFLLLLFFYYYLNSSQEPLYMYDYSSLNQEYLISLYTISLNIILLSLVIYFMYFTMLRLNSNSWEQISLYILIISSFIFFSFFIETYQFYYVISLFNERLWLFNEEENLWSVEVENPILRTKTQYFLVCLIAKYWHFLFIFLSWVFFVIKSFERRKFTYVLFGANLQNVIILYVLNLACYLQWFKWIYRRFFDLPYTWFFTNIDNKILYNIWLELKLIVTSLINFNGDLCKLQILVYKSLNFWAVDSLCIWKFI